MMNISEHETKIPVEITVWVVRDPEGTCFESGRPWKSCIRHATGLMEWERFATYQEAVDYTSKLAERIIKLT